MTTNFNFKTVKPIAALEIALASVLLLALFFVVRPLFAINPVIIPATDIKAPASTADKNPHIDTSILSTFDPFHRDAQGKPQETQFVTSAPETKLDLEVYGMRADIGGDSSSAIILTPDGKQATYFVGDEIIPGVTLERVDIDFVILDSNGVKERLSRYGKEESESAIKQTVAMSALAFKAQDMINDLRFYPHREGRAVIGYRVRSRRGQSLEKYGFQQNDIITAINGESLTQNRVNLPNLWKNLKQARYASIQIIRDDLPTTIEVNLQ